MRIIHFTESFSSTTETFIYNYVRSLQEVGGEHIVVTLARYNIASRPYNPVYLIDLPSKWHPERIWSRIKIPFAPKKPTQYEAIQRKRLKHLFRQLQPDIIHAQFGPAGVLVAPVASLLNMPLVVTFHGYDISQLMQQTYWKEQYKQKLIQDNVSAIGVSNFICRKIVDMGFSSDHVHLLHGGADLSQFTYSDPFSRYDGHHINCVSIGRMTAKKDPISLIKAFEIAYDAIGKGKTLTLTMAGDGPLFAQAKKFASDIFGEDQRVVRFLGTVPHTELNCILHDSHIYMQYGITAPDGDHEGQGISLVEASASGLPVIITDHNGFPDVVLHEKTGLLSPEGDVQAMADNLLTLIEQPELWQEYGKNGRQHMEKNFSLPIQAARAYSLLQQLSK